MNRHQGEPGQGESHFALMDKVYRRQRHFYDFTRKYYLLGRDRLIRELDVKPGESVIEIGCGTARNLIRIARTYPDARLYGLDASAEMLASAENSVRNAGVESKIGLARGLAEEVTPSLFDLSAPFDHVLFPYSLSMIPDWRGALRAAYESLAPGGRIHVVDFGDLKGLSPFFANGLRRWLKLFHVTPRSELLNYIESLGPAGHLNILPGRYAFVWHARHETLGKLAAMPVA